MNIHIFGRPIMLKQLPLIAFICIFGFNAEAQVSINFERNGSTTALMRFSNISYWVEYQVDTVSTFNSPWLNTKISKSSWNDSVVGLKLNRIYNFRCRQVKSDGSIMSAWTTQTYYTATYPLSYFFSGNAVNIVNEPFHKFYQYYYPKSEIWIDDNPNFNSPNVVKTSRSNSYDPIFNPYYKSKDTFYIRVKVVDKDDSLPWKTIALVNGFKPSMTIYGTSPCTDSSVFNSRLDYNLKSSFQIMNVKAYVQYNNTTDSGTFRYFSLNLALKDNNSIRIITQAQLSDDTFFLSFIDTSFLFDPLNITKPLYNITQNNPTFSILFTPNSCNSKIELENHTDTNYNSLISSQITGNKTFSKPITFLISWDMFVSTAWRYRLIRADVAGPWINIDRAAYVPAIAFSSQVDFDTSASTWSIYRSNSVEGKKLEIELDISNTFNSPKKKTYLINDSTKFSLESLFGKYNYVRCRLISGSYVSNWSNTVSKYFTTGSINNAITNFTQPYWLYGLSILQVYSGAEINFGHSENDLPNFVNKYGGQIPDTFDFVDGDTVYFRLRRFTPIDTSLWSRVMKNVYKGNKNVCFIPKITYNGSGNGKDSFHVQWLDKNPLYSEGFQLILGPSINAYKGIIEIPKGNNSVVIYRNQFPPNWYFSIYSKCSVGKNYSGLQPKWYTLDGRITAVDPIDNSRALFFSQNQNTVINPTDNDFNIKIYDQLGRVVFEGLSEGNSELKINGLGRGIYFLSYSNAYTVVSYFSIYIQ